MRCNKKKKFGKTKNIIMKENLKEYLSITGYIDEGNFGRIELARKVGGTDNNAIYAVKTISSAEQTKEEYNKICDNEIEIFKIVKNCPFFIQLKYVCKTESIYRFVMDYKAKGTMFNHLMNVKYLGLDEAMISICEIVLALEYLHQHNVVYRDLKLENILIDDDHHILLADFGLAKQLKPGERLGDRSGTTAYMAPEILIPNKLYGFEVDWWSLGIISHELLMGYSPFMPLDGGDISNEELCRRILKDEISTIKLMLRTRSKSTCDFIFQLLKKNPKQRLGNGSNGFEQIKCHPYFGRIDWMAIKQKSYKGLYGQISRRSITQYEIENKIPVETSRPILRHEFFYTAPELKSMEQSNTNNNNEIIVRNLLVCMERVQMFNVHKQNNENDTRTKQLKTSKSKSCDNPIVDLTNTSLNRRTKMPTDSKKCFGRNTLGRNRKTKSQTKKRIERYRSYAMRRAIRSHIRTRRLG